MALIMSCWVLAMVSGLSWGRRWTSGFTLMTVAVFLWTRSGTLTHWTGWLQLSVVGLTPWLLATQRRRDEQQLSALQAEEAQQTAHLSEAARSLLSLQTSAQQMETQLTDITNVYHLTKATAAALHLTELFTALLDIIPRLFTMRGLRLIDLSGETPQVLRAERSPDGRMVKTGNDHVLAIEEAIIKRVASSGQPSSLAIQELALDVPPGMSRMAWAPLSREQKPIGVLVADDLPEEQFKMLPIITDQLSLQLSRIRLYAQVEELAVTDALTGLSVRRYFLERAREELARSKRHSLPCALLMADLDLFKEKNDTFGHLVGDVVLKDVARLLQRNLRDVDLIARFGGEEFIMLLIETRVEQAFPIVQRLKQLVEVHPIRVYDELLSQTISIGIAGFPDDAQTLEALIERADQALYAAKRGGHNRVARWSPSLTPAPDATSDK